MSTSLSQHEVVPSGNVVALQLPHPMDDERLDQLNAELATVMNGRRNELWVFDLTGVSHLNSAMLGVMVNLRHQIKTGGGKMVLCGMSSRLAELFKNSSMERLFLITKDRDAALR